MSSKIVLEDHAVSKTWKDSAYRKVRLPRVPEGKVFKDIRFPSRNNLKTATNRQLKEQDNDSREAGE